MYICKNFIVQDFFSLIRKGFNKLVKHGFPGKFDFVYWNVWDYLTFSKEILLKLLGLVSDQGRLILGFYDSDKRNSLKVKKIKELDFKITGISKSKKYNVIVIWI